MICLRAPTRTRCVWRQAHSSVLGAVVCAGMFLPGAAEAEAQTRVRTRQLPETPTFVVDRPGRGWMGISIDIRVIGDGSRPGETTIRVVRTVDGSAAARAGVTPRLLITIRRGTGRAPYDSSP